MVHDFDKDNTFSMKYSDAADSAYRRFYNGKIDSIEFMDYNTSEGKVAQLSGVDKIFHLKDGSLIKVDEKTHAVSYGISFEFWSNWEAKKQGWLYTSTADYVAQIEPQKDKIIYTSMKAMREFCRAHMDWFKSANKMHFQTSTRNGSTWHSASVTVSEKTYIDWVNSQPGLEKVEIIPLHEYK